ncbi:BatD family protein [Teredinibacter turnerae]|uniref:BatD family protein n=1 Tax=Teredinibacter turnerae TaxID=2426 RepID=UPI00036632AC|nr:BatD family protein [Teredinibacter turnerae]
MKLYRSMLIQKTVAIVLALAALSCGAISAHAQTLTASVDRTTIGEDETLNLSVRYNGSSNTRGQPDFANLSSQFEILNQSQSNRMNSYNGRVESYTEWQMILAPRTTGSLLIPAFEFQGARSTPIKVTVSDAQPVAPGNVKEVFIETSIDKEAAYVQEQVILRYKFYYSVNIDELAKEDLTFDNVLIEPLEETRYGKTINGKPFQVVEFGYALFPQASGVLEIPEQTWNARISRSPRRSVFDFNGGRYELKRLKTASKTINIKEKPASFPAGATWLPSSALTLAESWASDPSQFKVGEPITRTLNLQANGLISSQLPEINTEARDTRLKIYPDQPKLNDKLDTDGAIAQRIETSAVVVNEGGEIGVPGVRIPWWNTVTDELEYAEIPDRKFWVAAGEKSKQRPVVQAPPAATEQNNTQQLSTPSTTPGGASGAPSWLYLLVAVLILTNGVSILLWLRASRQRTNTVTSKDNQRAGTDSEKSLLNAFKNACEQGDEAEIRRSALAWAQAFWGKHTITSLSDIARKGTDSDLKTQCLALDASLFRKDDASGFDPTAFYRAVQKVRDSYRVNKSQNTDELAPLYHG